MFRGILAFAGALLVGFHVWLFAGQALDGQLADVALLARWAAAGGLALGLLALRSRGDSLFRGRQAVAIWLLAALLHAPAVAERAGGSAVPPVAEIVAVIAPLTLAGAVAFGLLLLLAVLFRSRRPPAPRPFVTAGPAVAHARFAPARIAFAPRPPPAA